MYKISDEIRKFIKKTNSRGNYQQDKKKSLAEEKSAGNVPGRFAITITIYSSEDTTESRTQEMCRRIQNS